MSLLLYFLPLILLLFTLYKVYKSQRKYLLELRLVSIYDQIELNILKSRDHLSNVDIKFLQANKNIAVNPQFLDVEFIIAINQIIKDRKIKSDTKWYSDYVSKESDELKALLETYAKVQVQLSILSALKAKFIAKALWINFNNFIQNRTINLSEIVRTKINSAFYSGNNFSKLAGC